MLLDTNPWGRPKKCVLVQMTITLSLYLCVSGEDCPQLVVDSRVSTTGNISSPAYPSPYPPDAVCNYRLQGVQWEGVKITFHHFDLEAPYTAGCLSDYLELATVDIQGQRTFRGRFCGRVVPAPILFLHPTVELVFRSNHAVHHSGFLATYEFIDEAYVLPPKLNGTSPCGGYVSGIGGIISSPGYPLGYSAGLDCLWLIRVPYQHAIYVRIQELEFQGSTANCQKALLGIYDGYEHSLQETAIQKRFCGDIRYYKTEDDRTYFSPRNRLLIRFTSTEPSQPILGPPHPNVGFRLIWSDVEFSATADNCTKRSRFPCKEGRLCLTKNHVGGASTCPDLRHYCISTDLVCDGIPQCGEIDSSDEHNCLKSPFMITILTIPCVLLISSLTICCICYKRRGDRRVEIVGVGPKKSEKSCCWRRRRKNSVVKEPTFHVDLAPLPRTPMTFKHELESPGASDIVSPASGFSDSESDIGSAGPPQYCPTHGPLPLRYISCHFPLLPVVQEQNYQSDTYDEGGSTYSSQNSDVPCSIYEKNQSSSLFQEDHPSNKTNGILNDWRSRQFRRIQRADAIYMSDDGKSSLGSASSPARVCPRCLEKESKGFSKINKQNSRDSDTHMIQFDSGIDSIENMKNVSFDTCTSSEGMAPMHQQNKWKPTYDYEYDDKTNQSVQTDLPNGENPKCLCSTVTTFGVADNTQTTSKATDV